MTEKLAKDGSRRGGARPGSGRKKGLTDTERHDFASTVYERIGGEVEKWEQLFRRATREQKLSILKFLSLMRHGHPAQRQEISSKEDGFVQIVLHGPEPPWAAKRAAVEAHSTGPIFVPTLSRKQ